MQAVKLGKKAPKIDHRTLRLSTYISSLPSAPAAKDWSAGNQSWGMMINDRLGDCTIAGVAHAIQVWTQAQGSIVTLADDVILSYYESWDGYVPTDPDTDQGGVELDVLKNWKNSGFSGHKISSFTSVNPKNEDECKQALNLFGGLYIGIELPLTAQNQDVWDVVPDPGDGSADAGSWGGHCVFAVAYDANGVTVITWGQLKKMTWAWWLKYCSEAYAIISLDWFNSSGIDPTGFNQTQLEADLAQV